MYNSRECCLTGRCEADALNAGGVYWRISFRHYIRDKMWALLTRRGRGWGEPVQVRKGSRVPTTWHTVSSLSLVSLPVDHTN